MAKFEGMPTRETVVRRRTRLPGAGTVAFLPPVPDLRRSATELRAKQTEAHERRAA